MDFTCYICQQPLLAQCMATGCGHVFHQICILQWTKQFGSCPECRSREPLKLRYIRWSFPDEIQDDSSSQSQNMFEGCGDETLDRTSQENDMFSLFDATEGSCRSWTQEELNEGPRFDWLLHHAIELRVQLNELNLAKEAATTGKQRDNAAKL